MIGVIVMLRPGSDVFRMVSLLPIMAALCYAAMTMMTRKLGIRESGGALTFYIQIAFLLISVLSGLVVGDGKFDVSRQSVVAFFATRLVLAKPRAASTAAALWSDCRFWWLSDVAGLSPW